MHEKMAATDFSLKLKFVGPLLGQIHDLPLHPANICLELLLSLVATWTGSRKDLEKNLEIQQIRVFTIIQISDIFEYSYVVVVS